MVRPVTVITGASAGIGAELARVFAREGHELVLVARREHALNTLADDIAKTGKPRPVVIPLDLGQVGSAEKISEALKSRDFEVQYIVNNAGFGLLGPAADVPRGELLEMIDLNVRALTELSVAFVDSLARHRGGILNVASVAGFLPGPGMAVYYAGKAFVVSFSEALRQELMSKGVRVTVLCPGPVPTEFQARAGVRGPTSPAFLVRDARFVAEAAYRGLMAGKAIVIPGWANLLVTLLPRFLPRNVVARAMKVVQLRRFRPQNRA